MFRTPGVGVVRKYEVVVADSELVSVADACARLAAEAEAAAVALVRSKPSG